MLPPQRAVAVHGAGLKGTLHVDIQGNVAVAVEVLVAKGLMREQALGRAGRRGVANMAPTAAVVAAGLVVVRVEEEQYHLLRARPVDCIAAWIAEGWGKAMG